MPTDSSPSTAPAKDLNADRDIRGDGQRSNIEIDYNAGHMNRVRLAFRPAKSVTTRAVRLAVLALALAAISPVEALASGLFDSDEPLAVRLDAPWTSLLRAREEPEAIDGRLVVTVDGRTFGLDARIKARGNWRLEHCGTPPLTVQLRAEQIAGTVFDGQTTLHLTTQCQRNKKYELHLFQEYLIYRLWGTLTDASLRARLMTIIYRDPERPSMSWTGNAFAVEDINLAAERMERRWIRPKSIAPTSLDPGLAALFSLFQMMIGHTDWSIVQGAPGKNCCHNVALLAPLDASRPQWPVPFDFDASGLVNTGDTRPGPRLPIRSVRQRLYRGFCVYNDDLAGAIETMNDARDEILALFEPGALLTRTSSRSTLKYLEAFYDLINDPDRLESQILSRCRQ